MNGAESLVRTLVKGGVDVCFANPGTSEMHFVAALDRVEGMRCVLGLFEGVVTGAADGYYRMKGTPASTLLHLGPGLANGLANLHNAKKANSGIVNIVGQHAVYHIEYNAPLTSDADLAASLPGARSFAEPDYPTPVLEPKSGFTIDRALVYAIVRQESRFNPMAISSAGAVGLMQVLPTSAAYIAGDDKLNDRSVLQDAALNLRIGQDYLTYLSQGLVGDNMLLIVAAYNGGPGAVQKTYERIGRDADPLMLIESLPAKETRDYVEKVMAGYWIYRRQFGQDTPSLDAIASGAQRISLAYDRSNSGSNVQTAAAQPAKAVRVETTAAAVASLY